MENPENVLPPSKKRAAGRELSRDNPGLDDDDEAPVTETGTFKKASEEVMASRRIVKVKRHAASSTPTPPSSNPFAAIRLVPPTEEKLDGNKEPDSEKADTNKDSEPETADVAKDEQAKESESEKADVAKDELTKDSESEKADVAKDELAKESDVDKETKGEKENQPDNQTKETENKDEKGKTGNPSFSSFQQLSSTPNAFTGFTGTGFPSSTFSFGNTPKDSNPSFTFGAPSNTNGNTTPLFGTSAFPPMQEVSVETGEENEESIFTADSALFEFFGGAWKERGKGEIKVNVSTSEPRKARLVMRSRGNCRLILNANIFPEMKLTNMDKKGITFACINSVCETKGKLVTYALKFKDASIVEEFRDAVSGHQGCPTPALKTPENSPEV